MALDHVRENGSRSVDELAVLSDVMECSNPNPGFVLYGLTFAASF